MKMEFIDYLHKEGWKLVSDQDGVFKFDRVGPFQLFVKNETVDFMKFNLNGRQVDEPFLSLVASFTGLELLTPTEFADLMRMMGVVKPISNARAIGYLNVDKNLHCTAIAESLLKHQS